MRTAWVAAVVLIALVASCVEPETPAATTTTSTTVAETRAGTTTTSLPATDACPLDGAAFHEGGVVETWEQAASDSRAIGRIAWRVNPDCEVLAIWFQTAEGAPATTPPSAEVAYLQSQQIIRVHLDVAATSLIDQLVETPLVDRLFVVRGVDGDFFVDLHLASPAQARARVDTSPARLLVYLQPGLVPFQGTAAVGDRVVVTVPLAGSAAQRVLQVSGYARTGEAEVIVIATAGGTLVSQDSATAADQTGAWGEFRATIDLPARDISLFVGEQRPNDGSLTGVTVSLTAP